MRFWIRLILTLLLTAAASCMVSATRADAQPRPADGARVRGSTAADSPTGFPRSCKASEVQVMLLGTFHFEGSARDDHSAAAFDWRTRKGQADLDTVVARIARWSPQQVAVERVLSDSAAVATEFASYTTRDSANTTGDEVAQLAFRLARSLKQTMVYPIDYQIPIGNDSIGALLARRSDLRQRADSVGQLIAAEQATSDRAAAAMSLVERLRAVNSDSALHAGNSGSMFYYLAAGEGANRGGPQLLARWYERNFQIAHNLTRVIRPGTRRVLVLVGSGHVPPLRNILDESPEYCPVSPLPFLH